MKTTSVLFPSGVISLEGITYLPEGAGLFPAVIVCHPHPLYGGSMVNNVVDSLCEALVAAAILAFKFNFRGVGGSEGDYGDGVGEQDDVRAAIDFIAGQYGVAEERLGIAGYSAGSGFSFPVAVSDARIRALAAISPPLGMYDFSGLKKCSKEKLLVAGTSDDFVPEEEFLRFCAQIPEPKRCLTVAGADHFWWGHESIMSREVVDFFSRAL
ncbi:alpha/beta hydrolase [Chloroflexota bacterium]